MNYLLIVSPKGRYYRLASSEPVPKGYRVVNHSLPSILSIGQYGTQKPGWKPTEDQIKRFNLAVRQ